MELQEFKGRIISGVREFYFSKFNQSYDTFSVLLMSFGINDSTDAKSLISEYSASIDLLTNKINLIEDFQILNEFREIKLEEDVALVAFVEDKFSTQVDHEKYALISALYSL